MNDMQKILLIGLLIFGLCGSVIAASAPITENGITGTETVTSAAGSGLTNYGEIYVKEMSRFASYDIPDSVGTGTYIYNNTNGTTSTAGRVNTQGLIKLSEMLTVNSLAGGTITAAIEIGIGSNTTWYEVTTINFTATNTTNFYSISQDADRIRVGWKKSVLGSATVSDVGSYKGNVK